MSKVFVHNVDCYTGREIGKWLAAQTPGALRKDEDEASGEEDERTDEAVANYEIVGTLSSAEAEAPKFVSTSYAPDLPKSELSAALLSSDVIIYDISEEQNPEACVWAIEVLNAAKQDFATTKVFICVSTVLTWARTKGDPDDPEAPLTEDDYRRRKAHPNFKETIAAEKLVVKSGKKDKNKLSTYVVCAGLCYGAGENLFHFLFKGAWHGEPHAIPIFGHGENMLPMVHVKDLAQIVHNVIESRPTLRYLLAVDESNHRLEEVVGAISENLGTREVQKISKEEALLLKDLEQVNYDMLLVNLRMEPGYVKEMKVFWNSEAGIVDNINTIIQEYKTIRGLSPLKIMIHGPPAAGKTYLTERICKKYKLHHIKIGDVIQEAIQKLEASAARLRDTDGAKAEFEDADADAEADNDFLEELKENARNNNGRYPDEHVIQFFKNKLNTMPCRNQGFVLDGYPRTVEQAQELFKGADPEGDEAEVQDDGDELAAAQRIMPEVVISLDFADEFLKDRVMNLPESAVAGTHHTEEGLLRRLEAYRQANTEEESVLNFFDELEIHPVIIRGDDQEGRIMDEICKAIGEPHNYGPTPEEMAEEQRLLEEERARKEAKDEEEREVREAEEVKERKEQEREWRTRLEEVKLQEQEVLEAQSQPLRNYLMKHVMPTLTGALIDVCNVRPEDPIDFLAEYLFKNNPQVDE